jgi:hypothetical protein
LEGAAFASNVVLGERLRADLPVRHVLHRGPRPCRAKAGRQDRDAPCDPRDYVHELPGSPDVADDGVITMRAPPRRILVGRRGPDVRRRVAPMGEGLGREPLSTGRRRSVGVPDRHLPDHIPATTSPKRRGISARGGTSSCISRQAARFIDDKRAGRAADLSALDSENEGLDA